MDEPLEMFRTETHAWLEANCPHEMRTPLTSEDNVTWGGRGYNEARPRGARDVW